MKKFTLFFALLLAMVGTTAKAQVAIQETTPEAIHIYQFIDKGYNNWIGFNGTVSSGTNVYYGASQNNRVNVMFLKVSEGTYKIVPVNIDGISIIGTTAGTNGTKINYYATEADAPINTWTVAENSTEPNYTLSPTGSTLRFTNNTSNSVQVSTATNDATVYRFYEVETYTQETIDAIMENEGKLGYPEDMSGVQTAWNTYKAGEPSLAAYKQLLEDIEVACSGVKIKPSEGVVYEITNAYAWSSPKYLNAGLTSGSMDLLWGSVDVLNNRFWKIVDGKLMNGNGYYVTYNGTTGNSDTQAVFSMTTNANEAANVVMTGEGEGKFAITFTNGTNTSNSLHLKGHGNGGATTGSYIIAYNEATGFSSWRFEATAAKVYTVVMTGDVPSDATVTRTVGTVTETAYNGGFFVTTADALDGTIAATAVEGFTIGNPVVDEAAKTITISYLGNDAAYKLELEPLVTEANGLLAKTGVGYPAENAEARTELSELATNIGNQIASETPSFAFNEKENLEAAIEAYKSCTDVQMPENGKAYTITSVSKAGEKRYMNYAESGYTLVESGDDALPSTAILICRDLGEGKYAFVNNAGKYFMWRGNDAGNNSVKGYADTYDATNASSNTVLTIEKLTTGGNVTGTQQALFGYMAMKGNRGNGSNTNYFVIKTVATDYRYDQAGAPFYNDTHSSALLIEEVAMPYSITPAVSASVDDVYVGTFSAPFPTAVPQGVKAYEITGKNAVDGTDYITCNVLAEAGEAIPANTGVLLVSSETKASVTMLPAAGETLATANGNLLVATGAEGTTVGETTTAYILANKSEAGVAFYLLGSANRTIGANKAYLANLPSSAVLKFNFNNSVTGIEGVEAENGADNAPIYDLSGRKVVAPVKGGIYIQNGKKVIF